MAETRFNISRNQLTYVGMFGTPMLEWFGNFSEPSRALLKAFEPFGFGLESLQITTASPQASQQQAQFFFGAQGHYLCKLDRCEANFFNITAQAQAQAVKALGAADAALREIAPKWHIRSQQFTFSAHGELEGRSVEEMLGQFRVQVPKRGGLNKGAGVIFHWHTPERNWESQLMFDASLLVKGGLFLSLTLTMEKGVADFAGILKDGRMYLRDVLEEVGVTLPPEGDA